MRSRDHDGHHEHHAPDAQQSPGPGFELPPGATFEPDPQQAITQATTGKDKHAP
jgi:putative (di)nucleoside polyphosphate hydrolase